MIIRFFRRRKRRLKMKKVKEGNGHKLKEYRFWNIFTGSLFHLEVTNDKNEKINYAILCKYFVEEPRADLYCNGTHIAYAKLPAIFPVKDGVIEIENGGYGINKIHYDSNNNETYSLYPDKRSVRGLRMSLHNRFPKVSSFIAIMAVVVLLTSMALGLPQLIAALSQIPWVSENIGTFVSPIVLPALVNLGIVVAGILAGVERTLMLRNHWLIDMETSHWDN